MVFETENTLAVGERGKDSGDGRWILVWKNGIGGGGEGFPEANRETAARRERAVTGSYLPRPSWLVSYVLSKSQSSVAASCPSLTWRRDIRWVLRYRRIGEEPSFVLSPVAVVVSSLQPTEH